jgi:hypothetical protein
MKLDGGVTHCALAVFVASQYTGGEGDAEVDIDGAYEDAAWRAC